MKTRTRTRMKKIWDDDDDDDTIMTELTQESSMNNGEFGCHLIDGDDNKYDTSIVIITTQVLFSMKQNLNWRSKRNKKWQKEKYSRKVKMKNKIASMIVIVTDGYPTSDDDVSREHETKGILKMIDRRKLTKNKRMPNQ